MIPSVSLLLLLPQLIPLRKEEEVKPPPPLFPHRKSVKKIKNLGRRSLRQYPISLSGKREKRKESSVGVYIITGFKAGERREGEGERVEVVFFPRWRMRTADRPMQYLPLFPQRKERNIILSFARGRKGGRKGGIAWFGCSVAAAEVVKWRRRYFKYCGSDTTCWGDREKERDIAQEYMGTDMGTTQREEIQNFSECCICA